MAIPIPEKNFKINFTKFLSKISNFFEKLTSFNWTCNHWYNGNENSGKTVQEGPGTKFQKFDFTKFFFEKLFKNLPDQTDSDWSVPFWMLPP